MYKRPRPSCLNRWRWRFQPSLTHRPVDAYADENVTQRAAVFPSPTPCQFVRKRSGEVCATQQLTNRIIILKKLFLQMYISCNIITTILNAPFRWLMMGDTSASQRWQPTVTFTRCISINSREILQQYFLLKYCSNISFWWRNIFWPHPDATHRLGVF